MVAFKPAVSPQHIHVLVLRKGLLKKDSTARTTLDPKNTTRNDSPYHQAVPAAEALCSASTAPGPAPFTNLT